MDAPAEPDPLVKTVVVLALDDVIAFDLATPIEVFGRARHSDMTPAYRVLVAGPDRLVNAGPIDIRVAHGLDVLETADTIIVPGLNDPSRSLAPVVRDALIQAHQAGTRIASICVGSFILAAAGLLDGRRAATHWAAAGLLARLHPRVEVDANVLFVDADPILTSAGAAAGIDLCLHVVSLDFGNATAAEAARTAVVPLIRAGGQAQFISNRLLPGDEVSLAPVLEWLEHTAHEQHTLDSIAAQARLSTRTLHRRFQEQTGQTPMRWLAGVRIRHAQSLLETTANPIERIAHDVGFPSLTQFRSMFRRITATTPTAYRSAFTSTP
jgi:transcriptional regulator GlxA family with amidase domain